MSRAISRHLSTDQMPDQRVSVDDLVAEHSWFDTAVGPPDQWPHLLRIAFSLCRHAPQPMAVAWGPEYSLVYNDAFAQILGDSHPGAFAQPVKDAWPEAWDDLEPLVQRVVKGTPSEIQDRRILLKVDHHLLETHFAQWLSPVKDDDGSVRGVLITAQETTFNVLAARRRRLISRLTSGIGVADNAREACALAMRAVTPNHPDIPFGVMYLMDATRTHATRLASVPDDASLAAFPDHVDVRRDATPWPLRQAAQIGNPCCTDVTDQPTLPRGPWDKAPHQIVVAPILLRGIVDDPCGLLVAGLNPYRPYDSDYEDFFVRLSTRMATVITSAMTRQAAFEERISGVRRQRLADAAPLISARQSRHQLLHHVADQGRRVIGAHHAVAALLVGSSPARAVAAISSSEDTRDAVGAEVSIVEVDPDGILSADATPVILSPGDIETGSPLGRFLESVSTPTPFDRILLAAIDGRSGSRLGLIVVCNPFDSDFGPQELDMMSALSVLAAVAIENAEYDERLRRAYAAREEVLAIVSHDLRNPLNTVALALEVLLHVDLTPDQHQKRLEVAQRAVTQANRLIDDLLDAALLEAGQITVKPTTTDVHQILATVADQTRPLVEINELELIVRPDDDLPPVLADPTRLIQILQNLIGNAVKVMREGTIRVTATTDPEGANVVFRVQDMGPGIPESEHKAVFTRFWRGSGSPRKSAGLGLAIAQGLVKRHGGDIWVESIDGEGAAFVFTMPVAQHHHR